MQRAGAMNLLSFLMNDMTEENRKLKLIIFPGETVVIDEYGKRIVACPTEDEAEEYIRESRGRLLIREERIKKQTSPSGSE